ncbi:hypothetical protein [Pseudomonas amygdali]|uniref:hypothetical protein n=1 Tax=Pseudomonas amygdali TaxID=47877 RepID=UPI0011102569|nr:hypothetical protein [Pseudomonas amygdali]QED85100.1 hypothetical protein PSYTB_16205 [Pseudomonas amygdali pv. tabaci str. ATCC 11528]
MPIASFFLLPLPAVLTAHRNWAAQGFELFFGTVTVLLQNLKPQIQYIQQNPLDAPAPAECNAPTVVGTGHCAEVSH